MLLLCLPLIFLAGFISTLLPAAMAGPLQRLLGALFIASGVIAWLAAIIALWLLVASVVRKNPQVQFLVEFVLACAALVLLPRL